MISINSKFGGQKYNKVDKTLQMRPEFAEKLKTLALRYTEQEGWRVTQSEILDRALYQYFLLDPTESLEFVQESTGLFPSTNHEEAGD